MPHKNFNTLRKQLVDQVGEDRVRAVEKSANDEYEVERLRLGEVRHAQELTQTQLARTLGVSQAQVSRIERQGDLYLSTLASYIEAMGGDLELTAVFGDRRIELAIGELADHADVDPDTPGDLMTALTEELNRARAAAGELVQAPEVSEERRTSAKSS